MMDDQLVFRMTLLAFIVAGMAIGIPYRVRAARTGERISRRGEGPLIMVTLRLCGGLTMLCLVAFIVRPRWTAWAQMPLPDWLRLCGAVPALVGLAWMLWVFRHLGANVTDTVVVRSNAYLVTSGPYRWVRHPMYVGGAAFLGAWFLLAANWAIALQVRVTSHGPGPSQAEGCGFEARLALQEAPPSRSSWDDPRGSVFFERVQTNEVVRPALRSHLCARRP